MEILRILESGESRYRTLCGSKHGLEKRKDLKLDVKDQDDITYKIILPSGVNYIHLSYLLGLFSKSVKKFGISGFRNKYNLEHCGRYEKTIDLMIREALLCGSVLNN